MKKVILFAVIICLTGMIVSAQNKVRNPSGNWKFDAPYAPQGYNSGKLNIDFARDKFSTKMTFTGNESGFTGENVKMKNDSLFFSVFIEGQYVNIGLKIEDGSKMSGTAVYTEGSVPLTCIRSEEGQVKQ